MPRANRPRRERTQDWQKIKQYTLWPEQQLYERLRTVTLFNESAAERARETGTPERTLQRQVERFEERGMISLFPKEPVRAMNLLERFACIQWMSRLLSSFQQVSSQREVRSSTEKGQRSSRFIAQWTDTSGWLAGSCFQGRRFLQAPAQA